MRTRLAAVSFAMISIGHPAAAQDQGAYVQARQCSDQALRIYASKTCEPIEQIVELAVQKCQASWNNAIETSVGPAPHGDYEQTTNYLGRLSANSEAAHAFYVRHAKVMAIDLRAAAGNCAPR